jgi:anti-sigma regulatory factor (Ser/Thr protein kinase)
MTHKKIEVTETSQVGEARRLAVGMATDLGFNEIEAGRVAIVVSEAAGNLARYAQKGEMIFRSLDWEQAHGLEILTLDKGPGMANVSECLQDGFSTSGSAGIGLGAIARQSDHFEVYSIPGMGTVLLSRLWSGHWDVEPVEGSLETGVICLPFPGELITGDAWAIDFQPGVCRILVADGLGHGQLAAAAALAAKKVFEETTGLGPAQTIEKAHSALRSTRGSVMAVAEVDHARQTVRFSGVGNISGSIYTEGKWQGLVSFDGIVGQTARKFQDFTYTYRSGASQTAAFLVMHSDGLSSHWNFSAYPGLMQHHPSLIAGVLYRDFKRDNDDLTVLVTQLG